MPVETTADRAALFSTDEFATAAEYVPPLGGAGTACSVVFDHSRPKPFEAEAVALSGMRGAIAWQRAMLRRDEIALVEQGGTVQLGAIVDGLFVPAGDPLAIVGRPDLDESGQIWTVDLDDGAS